MSSGTPITIDFGSTVAIDTSLNTMPTLPAAATASTTGDHVKVTFNWHDGSGNGSWKNLFAFKTDSIDLGDGDIGTADIQMDVSLNAFYTSNFISDETNTTLTDGDGATPTNVTGGHIPAPSGGAQSVAREYVRYIAEEIFGRVNSADLFSNEGSLVTDVEGQHTDVLADIKTSLTPTDYTQNQVNTNPLWLVMSQLIANGDASGTRFDASGITLSDASGAVMNNSTLGEGWKYMPLTDGDKLVFSIDFASIAASAHGIGENDIPSRKYKIEITLKD